MRRMPKGLSLVFVIALLEMNSTFWTGVGAVAVGAVVTAVLLSLGNESKTPPTSLGSQGAF